MKLPIEIQNSKVPVWLSYLAPIEIHAFSFGPFIWCRGIFSTRLRNHETIHWRQQLECLFIGHWILYILMFLWMLIEYRGNMRAAYINNPFERECYANDIDPHYLESRKLFSWVKYMCHQNREP